MKPGGNGRSQRAAVYCRSYGEESGEGAAIQDQQEFARRFASFHSLSLSQVYSDEGEPQTTDPVERPAGKRMLEDARAGKYDLLLVYRLDRLSLSLWHLLNVYRKLEWYGVAIRSMTEPIDTSTAAGRFVFQLLGSISEVEREHTRKRASFGRVQALADGRALGRTPFGYRTDGEGKPVADPKESALVKEIFALAAEGDSAGAIARRLNERAVSPIWLSRGYRAKGEVEGWTRSTVTKILHNPVYWTGEWRYTPKGASSAMVPVPALVGGMTAHRALRQLSRNNLVAKRPHRPYLLSGLIRCECGRAAVGSGGSGNRVYYLCPTQKGRRETERSCGTGMVRADLLDAEVWNGISRGLAANGGLGASIKAKLVKSAEEVEAIKLRLDQVNAEYSALVARRLDAQVRGDNGEITREELTTYLRDSLDRARQLEAQRAEVSRQLAIAQDQQERTASTEAMCDQLPELMVEAGTDPELKRQIAQSLVREVVLRVQEGGCTAAYVDYLFDEPRLVQPRNRGNGKHNL